FDARKNAKSSATMPITGARYNKESILYPLLFSILSSHNYVVSEQKSQSSNSFQIPLLPILNFRIFRKIFPKNDILPLYAHTDIVSFSPN
ncbi:MAG: hypothetical protein SPF84_00130, partial [Lachnospiraceae bacterium]|nr:hypothetical protein [Lachnospiraceae bacterium]